MSIALDLLTIFIFAAMIYGSWRKGFARSVIEFAGYIVSFAAAFVLSSPVGNWIYGMLIKPLVYSRVTGYIRSTTSSGAVKAGTVVSSSDLSAFMSKVPDEFKKFLNSFHLSADALQAMASGAVKSSAGTVTSAVTNAIVNPVAEAISRGIAFAVIFAVCLLAVKIIAGLMDGIFRLPVIGPINRLGGAAIGTAKAVVLMFLICTVVALLVPMLSLQTNPLISDDTLNRTILFKGIYNLNPVTGILLNGR